MIKSKEVLIRPLFKEITVQKIIIMKDDDGQCFEDSLASSLELLNRFQKHLNIHFVGNLCFSKYFKQILNFYETSSPNVENHCISLINFLIQIDQFSILPNSYFHLIRVLFDNLDFFE